MPTEQQIWSIADRLREKPERVSLRSVRAALPRGGSFRDIGPHLASWKAKRTYNPGIELSSLPEHMQTELSRAAASLWEAAMREATRQLSQERAEMAAAAAADRELRDEALGTADILSSQVESLKSEVDRLRAELGLAKAHVNRFLEKALASLPNPSEPNGATRLAPERPRQASRESSLVHEHVLPTAHISAGFIPDELLVAEPQRQVCKAGCPGRPMNAGALHQLRV